MPDWIPVLLLPNLQLVDAVECRTIAIAGFEDVRVRALASRFPTFNALTSKFTDAFGVPVRPSIVLVNSQAPQHLLHIHALASFRDAISVSTIPFNRALWLEYRNFPRLAYSNAFELYPWSLSKDYKHLALNTGAMMAMNDVTRFRGQSSPELPGYRLTKEDFDGPMLKALISAWRSTYEGKRLGWKGRALFRSLNMANQAMLIPGSADDTFYDQGRSVALWVSAFEILVHPGGRGRSDRDRVLSLIEQVKWHSEFLAKKRFKVSNGKGSYSRRVLGAWLYLRMNWLRNQFLHGNRVRPQMLLLPGSRLPVGYYAAPLYRLALTAFLELYWTKPIPPVSATKRFGKYISDRSSFTYPQRIIESGLATARKKFDSNSMS